MISKSSIEGISFSIIVYFIRLDLCRFFQRNKYFIIMNNFRIVSKKSLKTLTVCQEEQTGGIIILYNYLDQPFQVFNFLEIDHEKVHIIANEDVRISIWKGSDKEGEMAITLQKFDDPSEIFKIVPVKEKTNQNTLKEFYIQTFCGKVLGCEGKEVVNGTRVTQQLKTGQDHQKWLFHRQKQKN